MGVDSKYNDSYEMSSASASEVNCLNPDSEKSICVIGSGAAGLITAHTLIQDGFTNVYILTRDSQPGGVWEHNKVYSGVFINNVYGDYRFSGMEMPQRSGRKPGENRLSAEDMLFYMEKFAETHLKGRITYNTEVLNIRRPCPPYSVTPPNWIVKVKDSAGVRDLGFDRIVLCTGGCSEARIPPAFNPEAAKLAGFRGPVVHSSEFRSRLDDVLKAVRPRSEENPGTVVVIGGGKSAQDITAYLANVGHQRKVAMIFDKTDAFIASKYHLPDFVRKSRLIGVLSPHIELRSNLERFLHKTWLGGRTVRGIFNGVGQHSFKIFDLEEESPLRFSQDIFWSLRVNDEVCRRPNGFHTLAKEGKIDIIAPARGVGFGPDGRSIRLRDGRVIEADAIVLATGYTSSWNNIFSKDTMEALGLGKRPVQYLSDATYANEWNYTSLKNPPPSHPQSREWASGIYRGIVPAKNIHKRDFAINGAVFSTNNGFVFETSAHWISSYFLNDPFLKLPPTTREAMESTERSSAWLRKRYPDMLHWTNESHCSEIAFWNWPQYIDDLLDDMSLTSGVKRTGGNWLTWPFKVIDIKSIANLSAERHMRRRETV